jgi:hypothetical protein
MIFSILLTVCVYAPVLSIAQTNDQPREMDIYLAAPMSPRDERVSKIKVALDSVAGISESGNVYGNRIKLKRVPGKTVSDQQIKAALNSVDPAINFDVVGIKMWGLWVVKFKNYDQSKDPQVLEAFRGIGSAMENVQLVAPGVFSFKAGNQQLKRLIQRTFGRAAFGSAFDRNRDPADFIDTWVWGGTTAP